MQARPTTKGPLEWVSAEGSLILGCLRPTGRFLMHFAEMCAVMCLGAAFLSILFFGGAALIGHPNLTQRLPELSTLVIALSLSLPMAAWMRFRRHGWRPTLEMSGAAVVVGILLIGFFWLGIVSRSSLLEWQLRLACPVMLAVMLFRFRFYSGSTSHRTHAA